MISPTSITNFNRTDRELQEFWLFSMFVAGKNSDFAAKKLDTFLSLLGNDISDIFIALRRHNVRELLLATKVGQYDRLTKAIEQSLSVDLRKATLGELMSIHGIGPKTARFFLLHTRKDANCAALDTHILKFIRDNGYPLAPKSTPSPTTYGTWERIFLNICELNYPKMPIAEVDLKIWTEYSGRA